MTGPSDIEALLDGYVPDGDEISVGIAKDAIRTGRSMWARSEFRPGHFTASGFVASPDRTSLLLIHHSKLRRWLQPGGHLEADDPTVEESSRREIGEETGLTEIDRVGMSLMRIDAHPIPERGPEPGHIHIDLAMGFVSRTDEIAVNDEILDARWIPWGRLRDFDVDQAVMRGASALRTALGT
jgi:8-oxo-dGTP pyrophosphatase MutT (NUDIX family)